MGTIGENISKLRRLLNMNQDRFAEILGVTRQAVKNGRTTEQNPMLVR